MNCLEFRHHLLTDPLEESAGFARHRASCPVCAREAQQAWQFEQQLRAAAMVGIPDGLQARILLARALDKPGRSWRRPWLAMVASLLLVVGIAGGLIYDRSEKTGQPIDLQTAVFRHINDELDHLYEERNLDAGQLAGLFTSFGARVEEGIGKVNYAGRCTIRKQAGLHLVLPGQRGPVTVLFMPNEPVSTRQTLRTERFSAVIVPTGYGSVAVVGEHGETTLDEVLDKVSRHVTWPGI